MRLLLLVLVQGIHGWGMFWRSSSSEETPVNSPPTQATQKQTATNPTPIRSGGSASAHNSGAYSHNQAVSMPIPVHRGRGSTGTWRRQSQSSSGQNSLNEPRYAVSIPGSNGSYSPINLMHANVSASRAPVLHV